MHYRIIEHLDHYNRIWRECSAQFPQLEYIDSVQKKQNALLLENKLKTLGEIGKTTNRLIARKQFVTGLRELLGAILGLNTNQLDVIFSQDSMSAAVRFMQLAREYDPDLPMTDIYQAARNVWAMTGLQYLFHQPVELTSSLFAYSLLYPYTDNYLDDPEISPNVKGNFNDRFGKRINGERVKPRNDHERRVFDLIGMIEGQWSRKSYPLVYESLIAIHIAQIKSVRLLDKKREDNVDVLSISLEKGGASVVADGYLVSGQLSREQEVFLFGYGAFLQLLDDIQDISRDRASGQRSLYTDAGTRGDLEMLTNKTFDFGRQVMVTLDDLNLNGRTGTMKSMMSETAVRMLVDAVGRSGQAYSPGYVTQMEAGSPLEYRVIGERRKKMAANPRMLDEFALMFTEPEGAQVLHAEAVMG